MNADVYVEWLRRQGHRVVRTASSYWYDAAPGVFQAVPCHWTITPSDSELHRLRWRHGALAVSYSAPIEFSRGAVSYHSVLHAPYSLDQLDSQVRNDVSTGMSHFKIEKISFERLATEGWGLQRDTLDRQDRLRSMTQEGWERLCRGAQDLPGFEAWAATSGGELAAAVMVVRQGSRFSVLFAVSHRRFLEQHADQALFYCLCKELLQREGVESLFFTTQPLDAPAQADEARFQLGLQPKLVRHCVDLHPLLKPFAGRFFRRWARKLVERDPSSSLFTRAEGLLRLHHEGQKPIEEQSWPACLLAERSRRTPQVEVYSEGTEFQVTSATSFDVNALVDLHEACFSRQEHILVQLGRPFIQAVYRWFVTSPETFVLVAKRGDRILGLTTLSDRPYNLPMLRACKRELVKGYLRHPWALINTELLWRLVRIILRKRTNQVHEKVGQIAFTGVDPAFRGLGIGKALKDASIRVCRERGQVALSTGVRRQNHRARLLNEHAGFVEVPSMSTRRLIYLRLDLKNAQAKAGPVTGPRSNELLLPERKPCHIVIVTAYFWPVLSATTHLMKDLAEGLAEDGRQVTVLTNGPSLATHSLPDHPLLTGRIHRAWNPFLRRLGVFPKFSEYLWFMVFFVLRGLAIRKVDLIFVASTPPLAGLPAALLGRLKGAKLVYNLQDIFPDSAVVAGILPPGGLAYRSFRKAEEATYRVSDLVASISSSFSEYVQRLVPGTQVATIPNWVDTDHIRPRKASEDPAIAKFRRGGGFVVQYAGNIGFMQNLEVVLQAAECLKDFPDILFVFIGDGNAKQSLQELARRKGLANCEFLPLQPLERVPSVYNSCDLGVIPLKPGAARIAVPSKTWNYLAAGRPVVGCVEEDTPLAEAIRESRSGSVVPPSDPARLAEVILEYRNAPDRVREEGKQGRDYVETHLSRRVAIQRYIRMFDQLLGKPGEGA